MQREMKMIAKHAILLHAKSFLASPKNYLASRRHFSALGTQVVRWTNPDSFDEAWDERTALIASMIEKNAAVLEFGSGREQLERFLPAGCHYQPSDLTARSPRTLVCDLNTGFPALTRRYDVVVFSGVIEYIHDVAGLLRHVRAHADSCILSYMTTDALECIATRMTHGWVHHFSASALEKICRAAGFTIVARKAWQGHTILKLS